MLAIFTHSSSFTSGTLFALHLRQMQNCTYSMYTIRRLFALLNWKTNSSQRKGTTNLKPKRTNQTFYCYKFSVHATNNKSLCLEMDKNGKPSLLTVMFPPVSPCLLSIVLSILSLDHKRLSQANLYLWVNNIHRQFPSVPIFGLNWIPN